MDKIAGIRENLVKLGWKPDEADQFCKALETVASQDGITPKEAYKRFVDELRVYIFNR